MAKIMSGGDESSPDSSKCRKLTSICADRDDAKSSRYAPQLAVGRKMDSKIKTFVFAGQKEEPGPSGYQRNGAGSPSRRSSPDVDRTNWGLTDTRRVVGKNLASPVV